MGRVGRVLLTTGSGHYAVAATSADVEGAMERCREFHCGMMLESETEDWVEAFPAGDQWRLRRGNRSTGQVEESGYEVQSQTLRVVLEMFLEGDPKLEIVVRWEPV